MTLPTPRVSVLVPFLDAGGRLAGAVASVRLQTLAAWELILIDGGSRDSSRADAERLAAAEPKRIRVLRRRGLGIFRSRLWGARVARAPLIALLDSDDEWHPDYLRLRLRRYRRSFGNGEGMLYGPAIYHGGRRGAPGLQPTPRPVLHRPPSLVFQFLESGYAKTPCASGAVMARRLLLSAAPLARFAADNAVEDQYLWSFLALRAPILVSPEPLFWNRLRPDSTVARARRAGTHRGQARRHVRWLTATLLKRSGR